MADPQVGSVSFDLRLTRREVPGLSTAARRMAREGIDGEAVKTIGTRGVGERVTFRSYKSSLANARTLVGQIEALRGTLVTVTWEDSATTTGVLVEELEVLGPAPCVHDGSDKYMVTASFTLVKVE